MINPINQDLWGFLTSYIEKGMSSGILVEFWGAAYHPMDKGPFMYEESYIFLEVAYFPKA